MGRGQGNADSDTILYGRTAVRSAVLSEATIEIDIEMSALHKRFLEAKAIAPQSPVIDGFCIEEHTLYDLLDEKDFAHHCFPDGIDQEFKLIPALNFQVIFDWRDLQHEFPKMRPGEDLMYAEMAISRYARKLGFQLIGGNDPNNGDIVGFADLAVEDTTGFTMNFPLLSGAIDLEDKGIRTIDWI